MKLIHGDCIEEMAKMDAGSVDLTVTSPPYDNLRTYEGSLQWNEDIWKQVLEGLYRVTKEGGVVVWVVGDATIKGSETGTSFKQALYAMECGFRLHDTMIYTADKPPLTHNRYEQKFEYMFIFSKGRPSSFDPIKEPCKHAKSTRSGTTMRQDGDKLSSRSESGSVKASKIKGNVWFFGVGKNKSTKDKIAHQHSAIFPEQLAHDHIISWSNEGDTVFDPFLGSGTTGKMAKQLNRNFMGIEKVEKYYDIARERIGNKGEGE